MNILHITNYRQDRQTSMIQFGKILSSYKDNSEINFYESYPLPVFGKFSYIKKFQKWFGYIDKLVLFSTKLNKILNEKSYDIVHITDHSNAIYLPHILKCTNAKTLVTCHDLIAIRTANNEFEKAPKTSLLGRKLQNWIRNSLNESDFFACDSKETQLNLIEKIPKAKNRSKIIHLGIKDVEYNKHINSYDERLSFLNCDYLLHVGNDSWYKNRKSVIESFIYTINLDRTYNGKLVFIGPSLKEHELSENSINWLKKNKNRVIFISNISDENLQLTYQNAKVFLFPSFIEGFGWPPLEASLNNCHTISSRTGAIYEILRHNSEYIDNPNDQNEINVKVSNALLNPLSKKKSTLKLPSFKSCTENYIDYYKKITIANNL